ncbi:MAG: hypothetical protein IMZ69_08120 [Spirochaetes bacterium]|nr:hypothetical protein [Spirochaetota bacterium]
MIAEFFRALWQTVRRWALERVVECLLNWTAFRLMDAGNAIKRAGVALSDAADKVGGLA